MTLAAPLRLVTGAEPDPAGGAWMLSEAISFTQAMFDLVPTLLS